MKRKAMFVAGILLSVVLLFIIVGSVFYRDRFGICTWINNNYCTGKTVSEVEELLNVQTEYPVIHILYIDGEEDVITDTEQYLTLTYEGTLDENAYGKIWTDILVVPLVYVDNHALKDRFMNLPGVISANSNPREVRLDRKDSGFELYQNKSQCLMNDLAYDAVINSIKQGIWTVNLADSGAYQDIPLTKEEEKLIQTYNSLTAFLDFSLSYQIGEDTVTLDQAFWSDLLLSGQDVNQFALDEKGQFIWDEKKLEEAWNQFIAKYDTYGRDHEFKTWNGKIISLENGTYGNQIDLDVEKEWFMQAVKSRKNANRVPVYKKEAYHKGINDIGDTYIEVDITAQHLYYFKNGTLTIDTDIVTGNMLRKRETPSGAYFIYLKQKNRILRGPGYASHVNYWMPVVRGIGIHDALWRDEFGGEIYKTSGSHGCINTPLEKMKELYEEAEVGMPVIIHE